MGRIAVTRGAIAIAATIGLLLTGGAATGMVAGGQRGPAPTTESIQAVQGPFKTTSVAARNVNGFGSGTIYYPTDTSQGRFGVVAIVPGFVSVWAQISWLGPRLASQGFVVIGVDTSTVVDFPAPRGDELLAALQNVVTDPRLSAVVDPNRLAVAGWSMGGGGTLDATVKAGASKSGSTKSGSVKSGSLRAAIAIAPWENTKNFSKDAVPTMIIAGSSDIVASPADHAKKFYSSIPGAKAYVELKGKDHFFTTTANVPQAEMMIAWLKVNVDDDTRYAQFLCRGPAVDATFSAYQATCPNL